MLKIKCFIRFTHSKYFPEKLLLTVLQLKITMMILALREFED